MADVPNDHLSISEEDEERLLIQEARRDPLFYAQACDPKFIASRVHVLMYSKLQAVAEGKIKRLIFTVPPRTGKSRSACIEFPTHVLGNDPTKEIVVVGHTISLARDHSRASRLRMADPVYQKIFSTRIAAGNAKIDEWGTNGGGRYQAVGVGGGLTGKGADLLIMDDLVKDFQAAHSKTKLDGIWNWIWSVARTRMSPDGAIILIATRWSVEDPIGRMLDPKRLKELEGKGIDLSDERWEVVNLPALAESPNDQLKREIGESIFPERWSREHYQALKATSLDYIWSAMYCGNPVRQGGNYIPVALFEIIDPSEVPLDLRWSRAWDLATSSDEVDDETAGVKGAVAPNGDFYLRDMIHTHMDWPVARDTVKNIAVAERVVIGIEAVAGFKNSFSNLIEVLPPNIMCLRFNVDKDKLTRALPWIALVANRKVKLVNGPWVTDFILQCERFKGQDNDEDDMIDAVSGVYAMLVGPGMQQMMTVNVNDRLRQARAMRTSRTLLG